MIEFNHNDWGQQDTINKITILTKRGIDKIYAAIRTKYHKYPSTTIFKQANVLAKANKSP